jgi:hypothetical protein
MGLIARGEAAKRRSAPSSAPKYRLKSEEGTKGSAGPGRKGGAVLSSRLNRSACGRRKQIAVEKLRACNWGKQQDIARITTLASALCKEWQGKKKCDVVCRVNRATGWRKICGCGRRANIDRERARRNSSKPPFGNRRMDRASRPENNAADLARC